MVSTNHPHSRGILKCLDTRQYGAHEILGWNEISVRKLQLEVSLRGHQGCVNRLAWSGDGTFLASGSDDASIRLWSYPGYDLPGAKFIVPTLHEGNIFGVRFLPGHGSSVIVSGAMDHTVHLATLDATTDGFRTGRQSGRQGASPSETAAQGGEGTTSSRNEHGEEDDGSVVVNTDNVIYRCHRGRVKDVAVHDEEPYLFWSASEDGTVRQFDVRIPRDSQDRYGAPNVLLAVTPAAGSGSQRLVELKSLALNPLRSNELAIAASDKFVRLYDRRRLSLGSPHTAPRSSEDGLFLRMEPPHAALGQTAMGYPSGQARVHTHPTHVTFGNRGTRLLATYHGDNAYAWDVSNQARDEDPASVSVMRATPTPPSAWNYTRPRPRRFGEAWTKSSAIGPAMLLPDADQLQIRGSYALADKEYHTAITRYSEALVRAGYSPAARGILEKRAIALLLRGWQGDRAEALRNIEDALYFDPKSHVAAFQRARALRECGLPKSALAVLNFCPLSPDIAGHLGEEIESLEKDIVSDLADAERAAELRRARRTTRQQSRRRHGLNLERSDQYSSEPAAAQRSSEGQQENGSSSAAAIRGEGPGGGQESSPQLLHNLEEGYTEAQDDKSPVESAIDTAFEAALYEHLGNRLRDVPNRKNSRDAADRNRSEPWLWGALPSSSFLLQRFVGHCNIQTDIKEAVFLGHDDEFVACGSDDGRVFFYESATGTCLRTIVADEDVVNCMRPHPTLPVLATSGIESTVKIWAPEGEPADGAEVEAVASECQTQLRQGPRVLRGMDARLLAALTADPELLQALAERMTSRGDGDEDGDSDADDRPGAAHQVRCRMV